MYVSPCAQHVLTSQAKKRHQHTPVRKHLSGLIRLQNEIQLNLTASRCEVLIKLVKAHL